MENLIKEWREYQKEAAETLLYGIPGKYYVRYNNSILIEILDEETNENLAQQNRTIQPLPQEIPLPIYSGLRSGQDVLSSPLRKRGRPGAKLHSDKNKARTRSLSRNRK